MGFHSLVEGLQDVWGLAHSLEGVLVLVTVVALVLAAFVHIVVLDVHIGLLGPVHNLVGGLRNNRMEEVRMEERKNHEVIGQGKESLPALYEASMNNVPELEIADNAKLKMTTLHIELFIRQ